MRGSPPHNLREADQSEAFATCERRMHYHIQSDISIKETSTIRITSETPLFNSEPRARLERGWNEAQSRNTILEDTYQNIYGIKWETPRRNARKPSVKNLERATSIVHKIENKNSTMNTFHWNHEKDIAGKKRDSKASMNFVTNKLTKTPSKFAPLSFLS